MDAEHDGSRDGGRTFRVEDKVCQVYIEAAEGESDNA